MGMENSRENNAVSDSYISDVEYASAYQPLLNPLNIQYVTAVNGLAQGMLKEEFNYCDLGCGSGTTLNLFAAMYPRAGFYGVDFNESHINSARREAGYLGLENVTYYHDDFAGLHQINIPELDFITCYGAFSWVDRRLQDKIIEFTAASLSEQGKFIVEYAAKPGKVQVEALWYFMRQVTKDVETDSVARAKRGMYYLDLLRNKGALFFRFNPVALAIEKNLPQRDIRAVAHNALSEFQALHHSDVAGRCMRTGLHYCGSPDPVANHLELICPGVFLEDIRSQDNSVKRETLKDFILNTGLRTDIYVKNAMVNNSGNGELFRDMHFGVPRTIRGRAGARKFPSGVSIDYSEAVYRDIVRCLSEEALKYSELLSSENLAGYRSEDVLKALQMLVAAGLVVPFRGKTERREARVAGHTVPATATVKKLIEKHAEFRNALYLPSLYAGQAFFLAPVEALLLKASICFKDKSPVEWACREIASHGLPLKIRGVEIHHQGQLENIVNNVYRQFTDFTLPDLVRLGILKYG